MPDAIGDICSMEHLNDSIPFLFFRLSPLICSPNYILSALLVWQNKSKMVQLVRAQYLRQMLINFLFIVILSDVVSPIIISPIPGYFMTGLLATFNMNVALPLVLMTHFVLLVALTILQLSEHQLTSLSDVRFTKKFVPAVKVIRRLFKFCYVMMMVTAIVVLPTLALEFDIDGFRKEAFEYFHNPVVLCSKMFIADPRRWNIYVPYFTALFFGVCCSVTGVASVSTCLLIIFDSRKMVSHETLIMQRNFTILLIYQALVYVIFIIVPTGIISILFFVDIPLPENGIYHFLLICNQGAVTNFMHIVPGVWKMFRVKPGAPLRRRMMMWSTTVSVVAS